jgi:hypothetical protein
MSTEDLSDDERAELERLRARASMNPWARTGRWAAAVVLLLVGALVGVLSVVAVYLKSQVLDTETYVQTVSPLAEDPAVREAVATRLTQEVVTRADINGIATDLAQRLVAQGAPQRIEDLVGPAVSGLTSFLHNEIYKLLGTPQFQQVWDQVNRVAHQGVVTTLTGGKGEFLDSSGNTVTIDLGAVLSAVKQRLAAQGIGFVSKIPDVSIPYQLVDSDQLPKMRTYAKWLDTAGTWLPFVALALLVLGMLTAPNRRRGLIVGVVMLGLATALVLGAISVAKSYYTDNLPAGIQSPEAASVVLNTVLRYLVAALQTLLVTCVVALVALLLFGPSRPAKALRTLVNRVLDAAARALARAGSWVGAVGRSLDAGRHYILGALVVIAVVALVLANRPSIATVLWTTVAVVVVATIIEVFARAPRLKPPLSHA